jgi:hypothetical protein
MIQWEDQNNPYYGIVESLCFLYQEALRENIQDLADILDDAVEDSRTLLSEAVSLSGAVLPESLQDNLMQTYLLKSFQSLSPDEKWSVVRQMESLNTPRADDNAEVEATGL